ncbi:MAG: PilZ domain-containing protein [Planctomyces sp.]
MTQDPWSRPTVDDLRRVLESIGKPKVQNVRGNERLELSVPAEIRTSRGNTIAAMTREISRTGIGLLHRGAVTPGEVVVRMASDTREFQYNVRIEWCTPCDNGMFISGGCFLSNGEK